MIFFRITKKNDYFVADTRLSLLMLEGNDDKALLSCDDEHSAFTILYERYWGLLYRKALRRLGEDAEAQDAVQEVFISVWKNRKSIRIENSLYPYLSGALKYCIIKKIYRKAKKGIQLPLSVAELSDACNPPAEQFQLREMQQAISREVEALPDRMRQIYRLNRTENLSTKEIAELLCISEQTVKNILTTTLKKLRLRLSHLISLLSLFF